MENNLVVQSNDLVLATYSMTTKEKELLLTCISQIDSRPDAPNISKQTKFTITADEIKRLFYRDSNAKNILIEHNLRLVAHITKKYSSSKHDLDDLISIGTIGLIKGINSFDSSKGVRLATYVSRCVDNEILMYLRSIKKLNSEFYLEEPIGKDKDDNAITLQEILESNNRPIEDEVDLKFKIKKLYIKMKEVLKSREKLILELRFGLDGNKPKTQNEIAQMMGISRSYVSRIETKAIGKLAQEIREE